MAPTARPKRLPDRALRALPSLAFLGLVLLTITVLFGFEEPNATLVVLSAVLLLSAPVGLLAHLATSPTLTRVEKREWLRKFTSRRWTSSLLDYLRSVVGD
jgi:hypothetical protein